ncbi:MAG: phospholipid/cholesterol/gamma-HCH transport system substrate-binding protein, partial [Solirubrobacteraceae bacterium]|nr:phospholipid/cholesterol/gamma-HCH transport system substrate-binding protein [Solirubrobacteraceae bacterium]
MTRSAEKARRTSRLVAALGVGATIVAGIVGYVSYHALTGLPFQARYRVNVELPDAQRLGITDDVRIGGVRVGQVERVTAEPGRQGRSPYALARLSLDPSVHELPVDTEAKIRAASALGATYVQLELGHARETLAPGGTLPLRQASGTVSATDLFDIFNASAARNFQRSTYELSAGLAGRGENISETLGALPPLLSDVTAVSAALAAPEARLSAFITAFDGVASELSPARAQLAGLVANGARTLNALAGERAALGGTIEAAPPAEEAVTQAFTRLRPGLDGLADLVVDLRPAGRSLRPALVTLNSTLPPGVAALRGVAALAPPLRQTVTVLRTISHLPSTSGALRKLASLMQGLERTLSALTPAQVHCNII